MDLISEYVPTRDSHAGRVPVHRTASSHCRTTWRISQQGAAIRIAMASATSTALRRSGAARTQVNALECWLQSKSRGMERTLTVGLGPGYAGCKDNGEKAALAPIGSIAETDDDSRYTTEWVPRSNVTQSPPVIYLKNPFHAC